MLKRLMLIFASLAIVASACGSDGDDSTTTTTTTTAAPATTTAAPTTTTTTAAPTTTTTTTTPGPEAAPPQMMDLEGSGTWSQHATIADYEAASGNTIEAFGESPVLGALVESGELPPVSERLPADAQVVVPSNEIGTYGGTFMFPSGSMPTWEHVFSYAADMGSTEPNVIKSYEVNDDATVYTFHLREGLKWSDGVPMTANDWVWYYNNITLNEEYSPEVRSEYATDSGPATLTMVDDYTIQYTFQEPNGLFPLVMSRVHPPYTPVHYMSQFHPDTADAAELDALIAESGLTDWTALWETKESYNGNPDIPTIFRWKVTNDESAGVRTLERNPYYWKVDPAGNQLPYIDEVQAGEQDGEVQLVTMIAGEADLIWQDDAQGNYALLKEEEASGNFVMVPQIGMSVGIGNILFAYTVEDQVLADLFNSLDFRVALSIGTDRDEINSIIYNGLLEPSQWAPASGPPYNGERDIFKQYAYHDVAEANALLDNLGTTRDGDAARLRSDGETLELVMEMAMEDEFQDSVAIAELIKLQWERDLGIQLVIRPCDCGFWGFSEGGEPVGLFLTAFPFGNEYPASLGRDEIVVPLGVEWPSVWGPWSAWINSDGEEGAEAPAAAVQLAELARAFQSVGSPSDGIELERQIAEIHAENIWTVGLLHRPSTFALSNYHVFNSRMGNVSNPTPIEVEYMSLESMYISE